MNWKEYFDDLVDQIYRAGYGFDIEWQRDLQPCPDAEEFFRETCWVIINSGMKEQVSRLIWNRIQIAWDENRDISEAFNHKGKVAAMKLVKEKAEEFFAAYLEAKDKIAYLKTIPYIGVITCWHLAKNLGHDCCKPDRHLVRVAESYGMTPEKLCETISRATGEKVATVDIVIWRACNLGIIKF